MNTPLKMEERVPEEVPSCCGTPYRRRDPGYRFPNWWFVVMAAPNILPGIIGTAFNGIVWPAAIAHLAGYKDKTIVFAACGQIATVMSWSAPFVGAWSDKVPLWLARKFGRRRGFIVAGRCCSVTGNLLLYIAMVGLSKPSPPLLALGLIIMNLGGCLASPAFNAVIPDTVPLEQRGLCLTLIQWTSNVCTVIGFGVGWMLGEQIFFTDDMLWKLNIFMWGLDMPFFLIACNGTAGCWTSEHLPDDGLESEEGLGSSASEDEPPVSPRTPRSSDDTPDSIAEWRSNRQQAAPGCARRVATALTVMVSDFVSAFKFPTYRCDIQLLCEIQLFTRL